MTDNCSRTLELLLPAGPCSSLLTTAHAHRVVANPSGTEVSRCDGGVCEAGLSKPGRWAGAETSRSGGRFARPGAAEMCASTTSTVAGHPTGQGGNALLAGAGARSRAATESLAPLHGQSKEHQGRVVRLTRLTTSLLGGEGAWRGSGGECVVRDGPRLCVSLCP